MPKDFKDRLLEAINYAKLNKSGLAERLNVSPAYISQLCSGVRSPSDRTIADICRVCRVREEWLRTGKGDMEIPDTQIDKLTHFFQDVLATAPDERSAFIAALDDLPPDLWPAVAALAREYVRNLPKDPPEG